MVQERQEYAGHYSDDEFWGKLRRSVRAAGRELVEKAMLLFFVLRDPRTPPWAKVTVIGALGYFIAPLDAIPDLVPGAGFTDDLGVLAVALGTVAASVTPPMRRRARELVARWFGDAVTAAEPNPADAGPIIETEATVIAREPSA